MFRLATSTTQVPGQSKVQSDPCFAYVGTYGPTTEMVGNQRYINWPSMPLIPTYTADHKGNLNGAGEICGVDPYLDEVGLGFLDDGATASSSAAAWQRSAQETATCSASRRGQNIDWSCRATISLMGLVTQLFSLRS